MGHGGIVGPGPDNITGDALARDAGARNPSAVARLSLLLPVLFVVGCGASGNFSRDTSAGCVTLHGGHISGKVDTIARHAGAGAFRARVGVNTATVTFGRTSGEAKRTETAYARVLRAAHQPTKYLLFRN